MPSYPYPLTLTNPGAETGDTTGWTNEQGTLTATTGSGGSGTVPRTGSYFFWSGNNALGQAYQDVAIPVDAQTDVDSGLVHVQAEAYLSGHTDADSGVLGMLTLDGSGRRIARHINGAFYNAGPNEWHLIAAQGFVPPGTRTIRLYLIGARASGTSCDAYFDDVSLTLIQPSTAIVQTGTGLIYSDEFRYKNASLGAPWTVIDGTWFTVDALYPGFQSTCRNTPSLVEERALYLDHDAIEEGVVQAQFQCTHTNGQAGILFRTDATAQNGYLLLIAAGTGALLFKLVSGTYTQIGSTVSMTISVGEMYEAKIQFGDSLQKVWIDGVLRFDLSDATHNALTGRGGLRTGRAGSSAEARYDEFRVMIGNTVTVTDLPSGYKARVWAGIIDGGTDTEFGPETESGGTAVVDMSNAWGPAYQIDVLDGADAVVATLATDHVYFGDTYSFVEEAETGDPGGGGSSAGGETPDPEPPSPTSGVHRLQPSSVLFHRSWEGGGHFHGRFLRSGEAWHWTADLRHFERRISNQRRYEFVRTTDHVHDRERLRVGLLLEPTTTQEITEPFNFEAWAGGIPVSGSLEVVPVIAGSGWTDNFGTGAVTVTLTMAGSGLVGLVGTTAMLARPTMTGSGSVT